MPKNTRDLWKAWSEERASFAARDSTGFTQDVIALEAHIATLIQVCPKDAAGWPTRIALYTINNLQKDLETFTRYLDQLR